MPRDCEPCLDPGDAGDDLFVIGHGLKPCLDPIQALRDVFDVFVSHVGSPVAVDDGVTTGSPRQSAC